MSTTGEPTIFPSEAASSGGALRDTAGFAGRGGTSEVNAAAGGSGRGGGDAKSGAGGSAGLAATTPSSVRRASAGAPPVARLSAAPQVTQKR